ncbi:MAG TPA: hypothetical protein VFO46_02405 [Candidatus Sulfotelmatobacter sp.]|nr:hypothetical protein [Candidatus Sulfotelmatobacter sp.]
MIALIVLLAAIGLNIIAAALDQHSAQIAGKLPGARELNPLYRGKDGLMDGRGVLVLWLITLGLAAGHVVLYLFSNGFQYGIAAVEGVFAAEHFYGWAKNTRTVANARS